MRTSVSYPSAISSRNQPARADVPADSLYLGLLTAFLSAAALVYFFQRQEILLYGDATAHINIARRVFDSRTPGPLQLGTVWLPLPHVLMIPFVISVGMWSSGLGASIPSMAAYVAGTVGIFRLVFGALAGKSDAWNGADSRQSDHTAARVAAWCAALTFALNPNLIYLQATAMTEPLYLALFVWAAVYFSEFVQAGRARDASAEQSRKHALSRCGWLLLAAMLTRYDGWFAAMIFAVVVVIVAWRWAGGWAPVWRSSLRRELIRFVLILAIVPVVWFVYNGLTWGNPVEFATGPYSARSIEERTSPGGDWHYPGWHAPKTAAVFFVKAAKLNMAAGVLQRETERAKTWRLENLWFPLAMVGTLCVLVFARTLWPWLLLWLPLPFYAISIAWGGVPIYVPVWWPYNFYNVRYGLELLPVLVVLPSAVVYFLSRRRPRKILLIATVLFASFVGASYAIAWRATPVCLREAHANNDRRIGLDRAVAAELQRIPPGATVLMSAVTHAAALQFAAFPLRRTIHEGNNRLWRAALADPAHRADFIVAFQTKDDPVWRSVQKHAGELQTLEILSALDQPNVGIYSARMPNSPSPPTAGTQPQR